MLKDLLYQTQALTRFNIKKDFKRTCIWIVSLIVFTIAIGWYYIGTIMTDAERSIMMETLKSPAMVLLVGTAADVFPTAGTMFAIEMTLFSVVIIAIMNIFMMTHSTRQDEENGRLEIIRSLPTGRLSTLTAACIQALIVNVLVAIGISVGLGLLDFGERSMSSGVLYGIIMGASGFMFAMIVAVFVQLFQSNRTVISASFTFLGLNFVLRGLTDVTNPSLSWISPLAWSYKTEVYANNNWFPIVLMLGLSVMMMILALFLNAKRDLDGSFIKQRPGKIHASKSLLTPFGFVMRLNKITLISWMVGTVVLGATFGSVLGDLESFYAGNERLQQMFPGVTGDAFTKQFISMIACIFAITITIPILTFIGKIYNEEKKNHMENIVTKKISRHQLLATYLKLSFISSILFIILSIVSIYGVGYSSVSFNDIYHGMILFIPAIWFMLGLGIFLVGTFPKLFSIVWLLSGYAFFITYFGEMFSLPGWIKGLSPFYHIQLMTIDNIGWATIIVLLGLAVVLTILGFSNYNKRDITA